MNIEELKELSRKKAQIEYELFKRINEFIKNEHKYKEFKLPEDVSKMFVWGFRKAIYDNYFFGKNNGLARIIDGFVAQQIYEGELEGMFFVFTLTKPIIVVTRDDYYVLPDGDYIVIYDEENNILHQIVNVRVYKFSDKELSIEDFAKYYGLVPDFVGTLIKIKRHKFFENPSIEEDPIIYPKIRQIDGREICVFEESYLSGDSIFVSFKE